MHPTLLLLVNTEYMQNLQILILEAGTIPETGILDWFAINQGVPD